MSRIGRLRIPIPQGTKVEINGSHIKVTGKLGTLEMDIHERMTVAEDNGELVVTRPSDDKKDAALHGLTRSLVANMVKGVSEGYTKTLDIVGIGYKAEMKPNILVLNLGYSHPIEFAVPEGVKIEVEKNNAVIISGIDKQKIGQVAANIRELRPPDAYKGKGVRYRNEIVRLKEGKSGGK